MQYQEDDFDEDAFDRAFADFDGEDEDGDDDDDDDDVAVPAFEAEAPRIAAAPIEPAPSLLPADVDDLVVGYAEDLDDDDDDERFLD